MNGIGLGPQFLFAVDDSVAELRGEGQAVGEPREQRFYEPVNRWPYDAENLGANWPHEPANWQRVRSRRPAAMFL